MGTTELGTTADHIKAEQLLYFGQKMAAEEAKLRLAEVAKLVQKEEGKSLISAEDLAQIGTNKAAIETLKGSDSVEGSVLKTVKDEINDFATKMSDNGTVDTFKELVDYAASHNSEYSTLAGAVQSNSGAIDTLNGTAEETGSVAYQIAQALNSFGSAFTFATNDDVDKMIASIYGTATV